MIGDRWFPALPAQWAAKRLKFVSQRIDRKTPGTTTDEAYLGLENVESWTGKRIQDAAPVVAESLVNRFQRGDVLFGKLRPYLAKVYEAKDAGICSTEFIVLRGSELSPRYLSYSLRSSAFIDAVNAWTYGVKMPRAGWDVIGGLMMPVPSQEEQDGIGRFLDREVAESDALIADYETLIALLEEKRTALTTRAVTKGLDPEAPMKDSGVGWIGELPRHWKIRKLASAVPGIGSGTTPPADESVWYDGPVPFLTTTELRETTVYETARSVTEAALKAYSSLKIYPTGSVVIAMYGATIGRLGVLGIPSTVNQACCVIQPSEEVSGPFLYYWLLANKNEIVAMATGGGQPNISQETIRSLRLPLPPIEEQKEIARYLDQATEEISSLVEDVREAACLAKERRSALITAAVTGQIDINTYQAGRSA